MLVESAILARKPLEKKELKIELLNLSNSRITRLFIWLNLNGFGSIVKFFSMLFQNFKKLLKKIAGKTLGPIGVALAVYDFADCMGWLE